MTYCVGIRLERGIIFLSDTRTNAGVDHVNRYRKMMVWETPGDRVMVMLVSGNLAVTQAVVNSLQEAIKLGKQGGKVKNLLNAPNMFAAASLVGDAVRQVYDRDAEALKKHNLEFTASIIFGGQIRGEEPRLFNVYTAGNFIEASLGTPYLQIGESKYGKPILDRMITYQTPLEEAVKCALVSMDSTIRSNLSVGAPLDLLSYTTDSFKIGYQVRLDKDDAYLSMIHSRWGEQLRKAFEELPNPNWQDSGSQNIE